MSEQLQAEPSAEEKAQPVLPPSPPPPPPPDLSGKSFGWILLNHRESIFEMIAGGMYIALFAALYGATLGFYTVSWQILFSAIKAPILIFGTVAICLPALFTFYVLLGS